MLMLMLMLMLILMLMLMSPQFFFDTLLVAHPVPSHVPLDSSFLDLFSLTLVTHCPSTLICPLRLFFCLSSLAYPVCSHVILKSFSAILPY